MSAPDGRCHCADGVPQALKDEVRPYLLAAVEAGWARLWVAREVDLRRLALRRSASRILPPQADESQEDYDARVDAYTRALLPSSVVAGRPRRVSRQLPTNTISRRKRPRRRRTKGKP